MKTTINNNQLGVWLPTKLFNNLEAAIEEHNKISNKQKLNLAKAAYILNLLFYIPLTREEKYEDGWVPLCSKVLYRIHNYKLYINFLQDNGFLVSYNLKYSTTSKKCNRYKLGELSITNKLNLNIIEDNSFFIKKTNEDKRERMEIAKIKCSHLTKWLNPESISIDAKEAARFIKTKYVNPRKDFYKIDKRLFIVKSIEANYWSYSRDGKDNRLHSIFTMIPKDLRKYIKYDKKELISFDIKNSQPFIYASILNQLINPSINRLNIFLSSKYNILHTSIMSEVFRNTLKKEEIEDFIQLVLSGNLYEHHGRLLYNEGHLSKDINGRYYSIQPKKVKEIWVRNFEKYESLRDAGKDIMMQTLYSSEHNNSTFIKVFKKYYPEIYRITQFIKYNRDKNFFPVLLQNIEANCILDYCTKHISSEILDMPLFTIHDSIVTTNSYRNTLEEEFSRLLTKYFDLTPKLKAEEWNKQYDKAS